MKILLLASGTFALPTLELLAGRRPTVELKLISQPDQGKGRGRQKTATPAKAAAAALNLEVTTPKDINAADSRQQIAAFAPDYLVLVDYGAKLSPETIALPQKAAINLHPSLLPAYRGPSPMAWALINGEPMTGVTTQLIGEKIDCGQILLQEPTFIFDHETLPQLTQRLSLLGAPLVWRTIDALENQALQPLPQDDRLASLAPGFKKEDGLINWQAPAQTIFNRIRGLNPWPGTYTFHHGKRVKILEARPLPMPALCPPGNIRLVDGQLLVGCGLSSTLKIERLQLAGKPTRSADEFLRGYKIREDDFFGLR
ncbi:MAG: methionyl-tRNA formyltransferase [Deltaproteobacteria bacterium]|nr:methionyl-tRNA formyltransferase [Deltaproteobacteria bacterium]